MWAVEEAEEESRLPEGVRQFPELPRRSARPVDLLRVKLLEVLVGSSGAVARMQKGDAPGVPLMAPPRMGVGAGDSSAVTASRWARGTARGAAVDASEPGMVILPVLRGKIERSDDDDLGVDGDDLGGTKPVMAKTSTAIPQAPSYAAFHKL